MKINPIEIKKILCIKPRGIGDIVLSTIILDNLNAHFSTAKIHYLTEQFAKHSVADNPLVNKVLTFHKTEFILSVVWRIRKEKYDLLLIFGQIQELHRLHFFPVRNTELDLAYRGRKYAYNILGYVGRGDTHSAEHNLELLKALISILTQKTFITTLDNDKQV